MIVEKVLFSTDDPQRVVGVQVTTGVSAPSYNIAVGKEVILSGGTFGTPQLMLLSGIGPKKELSSLDIPCVKDSPHVGKHLLDVRIHFKNTDRNTHEFYAAQLKWSVDLPRKAWVHPRLHEFSFIRCLGSDQMAYFRRRSHGQAVCKHSSIR